MLKQSPESTITDLQETLGRLQSALAVSSIGLWECDIDPDLDLGEGRTRVSETLLDMLGYGPDEQVETINWFVTRYHPDDVELVFAAAKRHLADGTPFEVEFRIKLKSGAFGWIRSRGRAEWDESAKVFHMCGSMTDINDLKRAEHAAQEQREALAKVNRRYSLEHLTGSIAHELNQPLTGILSNAQAAELMLQKDQVELSDLTEVLAEIVFDSKRAGEVIRNLRELYREQDSAFLPVDINKVIDDTVQLFHSELVKQNVSIMTECAPGLPAVKGIRIQIQQVLVNLLMNGIQAMRDIKPESRQVCVATKYEAEKARVWVEDRGPGIDKDKLGHIFEPLATWKTDGTGMGLAISSKIIEAHHGSMWAENVSSGGARVGFVVPVLKQDHPR
jgi:C4-dicarboxylate-specific signal transduction histidine kinase